MSWFKIDDNFHAHPKVKSIPRRDRAAAVGLWVQAGSWCSQQLTDGHVPEYMVEEFGASKKLSTALVTARLWVENPEKGGWNFHDWHAHQPSRETVQAKRKQSAERIATWRAAKRESSNADVAPLQDENNGVTQSFGNDSETQPPTRPDPTRPDPTLLPTEVGNTSATATPKRTRHVYPDDFELFWFAYPKHVAKDAALKQWKSAKARAAVEDIVAGAERYARNPKRDPNFTKDPHRWLADGRWADQIEAAQADPNERYRRLG